MKRNSLVKMGIMVMPCVAALLLSCPASADVWQPPIGVPAPPFGITQQAPARPDPWTAPVVGYYYVNEASGADVNNPYGFPAHPRKSIPQVLPAGAVVELAGTYTKRQDGGWTIFAQGTDAQPVFIRGKDATSRPLITERWMVAGRNLILENLAFHWAQPIVKTLALGITAFNQVDTEKIVLRNSEVSGNLISGGIKIWTPGTQGTHTVSNIVIYDNFIHHNGDRNILTDQDIHGITVGGYTHNIWILNNEFTMNSGNGVQINGGLNPHTTFIYLGQNLCYNNKQDCYWTKQAQDVIFSQNESYNNRPSPSSTGAGMGLSYSPERVWFLFNYVHDSDRCFRSSTDNGNSPVSFTTDHYWIGNLCYNIHKSTGPLNLGNPWEPAAFSIIADLNHRRHIINNTVYDADAGLHSPSYAAAPFDLSGNIFAGLNPAGCHIFFLQPVKAAVSNFHNMLFEGSLKIRWGSTSTKDLFTSLPAFQAAHPGKGADSQVGDPQFVNTTQDDFDLNLNSPARNTTTRDPAYQTFQDLYGLSIDVDIDGVPRTGVAWNVGAY